MPCYGCKKGREKRQWNEGVRGGSHSSHNGSMEMVHQDEMAGQPLNMAQPPYQPQPGYPGQQMAPMAGGGGYPYNWVQTDGKAIFFYGLE